MVFRGIRIKFLATRRAVRKFNRADYIEGRLGEGHLFHEFAEKGHELTNLTQLEFQILFRRLGGLEPDSLLDQ